MSNEIKQKIHDLSCEIDARLEAIRLLSVEHNLSARFEMCGHTFNVLREDDHDPEDFGYLMDEFGLKVGDWVSSSELC